MDVTGVILAGGEGRRMDGADKGLLSLRGRPLAAWVVARLAPQTVQIIISANRNLDAYRAFGHPVVADATAGFAGPLAGIAATLAAATTEWAVVVPCDMPGLPATLVERLASGIAGKAAPMAIATLQDKPQPAVFLCRTALHGEASEFLAAGGRKLGAWQQGFHPVRVPFDDMPAAFANLNTPQELSAWSEA